MSEAFKCDRCGELVEGSEYARLDTGQYRIAEGGYPSVAGKSGELCKSCAVSFIDWWEGRND